MRYFYRALSVHMSAISLFFYLRHNQQLNMGVFQYCWGNIFQIMERELRGISEVKKN